MDGTKQTSSNMLESYILSFVQFPFSTKGYFTSHSGPSFHPDSQGVNVRSYFPVLYCTAQADGRISLFVVTFPLYFLPPTSNPIVPTLPPLAYQLSKSYVLTSIGNPGSRMTSATILSRAGWGSSYRPVDFLREAKNGAAGSGIFVGIHPSIGVA